MTNSESISPDAPKIANNQAQEDRTGDSGSTVDGGSQTAIGAVTEALSNLIRNVKEGKRDSAAINEENLREQDETDLVFGHYAAARWDK